MVVIKREKVIFYGYNKRRKSDIIWFVIKREKVIFCGYYKERERNILCLL